MDKAVQPFVYDFYDQFPDRKIVMLIKAGSHFFDLNSPNSDKDYKGVYMPSPQEFYEGESRRKMISWSTSPGNKTGVKNTKDDVDFGLVSITKFLDLLKRGDFNMMEMLHAPKDKILVDSDLFKFLRSIRASLMVNDVSAFLGFIKKEYKRYGVNINHYTYMTNFLDFLKSLNCSSDKHNLIHFWSEIKKYAEQPSTGIRFTKSLTFD